MQHSFRYASSSSFHPLRCGGEFCYLVINRQPTDVQPQRTSSLLDLRTNFASPPTSSLTFQEEVLWLCHQSTTRRDCVRGPCGQEGLFSRSTMAKRLNVSRASHHRRQHSFTPLLDPYPYAIDEAFDVYRVLVESAGTAIGMSGRKLNIIISGDSA